MFDLTRSFHLFLPTTLNSDWFQVCFLYLPVQGQEGTDQSTGRDGRPAGISVCMMWAILHMMVSSSVLKQSAASMLALLFLLTSSLADNDHDVARRLRQTGDIVPVERILKTLGGAHEVRVLEITLREREGHLVYSVEYIDPNGLVMKRQYDAKSGALLKTIGSE